MIVCLELTGVAKELSTRWRRIVFLAGCWLAMPSNWPTKSRSNYWKNPKKSVIFHQF